MSVKNTVAGSLILLLIIVGMYLTTSLRNKLLPIFRTYKYTQTLPDYQDPKAFTINFDPSNKKTIELQRECKTGFFYCKEDYISSPLYPHKELEMVYISIPICHYQYENDKRTNLSTEGRYLYADLFWNVFWIEIARCGEKSRFFGPYRSSIKLDGLIREVDLHNEDNT
jgi:hypothetical protein